jgi:hypothetical protein
MSPLLPKSAISLSPAVRQKNKHISLYLDLFLVQSEILKDVERNLLCSRPATSLDQGFGEVSPLFRRDGGGFRSLLFI